jgi:uncharacterized protein YjbI with pentapeptide repeats
LSNCDFDAADLSDATFVKSVLVGASFRLADIRGVDFTGAAFGDENGQAVFEGATADSQTTWPTGFNPHLAGVIMSALDETHGPPS